MQPKECQATLAYSPPGLYEDGNERKAYSNTYCWTKRNQQNSNHPVLLKDNFRPFPHFSLNSVTYSSCSTRDSLLTFLLLFIYFYKIALSARPRFKYYP